jgi:hypothetical protein
MVEAHEVTGAGPMRSRLQATAARGLTRFVGRTEDLHWLKFTAGLPKGLTRQT